MCKICRSRNNKHLSKNGREERIGSHRPAGRLQKDMVKAETVLQGSADNIRIVVCDNSLLKLINHIH